MDAPLFDSHCHLDFPTLVEDRARILDAAREAGVRRITTVGAGRGLESAPSAIALAEEQPSWISATVGLHPHDARLFDAEAAAMLERLAEHPSVVAIGETGLDYHYDNSPREQQREAFRWTVALARRVRKPLVIHTREAPEDTLAILREESASEVGGIIHCFSEDAPFATASLDIGFVSSFSGIATFKKATGVHDAVRALPSDAILVETDAPFLAPIPHRGKRNEPAYVAHTADAVARLRGEDPAETRRTTWANACRVFGLDPALPAG
jgi:TatD DNase family protein